MEKIEKICNKCKINKSIIEFYKDKSKKDGYCTLCKTCQLEYRKKHIKEITISSRKRANKYYQTHKEKVRKYHQTNREKILERMKLYRQTHKEERKIYAKKYYNNTLKTNINAKLAHNLRNRIIKVLKNINKSQSTINLLGCSIEFLKQHLAKQFKQGMNWSNYGKYGWHVDHIKPCASFNLVKPEEQCRCFHYTNLQPLWWKENLRKMKK